MEKIKLMIFILLSNLMVYQVAFAQMTDNEAAGACAAIFGGFTFFIIAVFVANIAMLVWVSRDAKARGVGSVGWMIVVFFTSIFGLIIYLLSRPKGEVTVCSHCSNKRLKSMAKCPHCGN